MTLVKRNHSNQMPRFFDSFLLKDLLERPEVNKLRNGNQFPAVNIKETEKQFEMEVVAPGLKKENFEVAIEKNILTISSVVEDLKEAEKENSRYTVKEFSFSSFKRSFSLPENKIEGEKIEAKYENGVLLLVLPKKAEPVEKVKKIKIL